MGLGLVAQPRMNLQRGQVRGSRGYDRRVELPFEPVERDEDPGSPRLAQAGAVAGLASAILLGASIRWAHHWGPLALALVSLWVAALVVALAASIAALVRGSGSRRLAKSGFALALVSVLALVIAGLALAAGGDPSAACGGG